MIVALHRKSNVSIRKEMEGAFRQVAGDNNHRAHVAGSATYGLYTTPGVYMGAAPMPATDLAGTLYGYMALVDPTVAPPGRWVNSV